MDMKLTRRQFMKGAAVAGVALSLPLKFGVRDSHAFYQSMALAKFAQPLRGVTGPDGIPVAAPDGFKYFSSDYGEWSALHYTININQFTDQLHPDFALNSTLLWGYHPAKVLVGSTTQKHLGGIIIAQKGQPIQITFRNNLPIKHIMPVDTTIPGANQGSNRAAVHVHGGLVPWISDGGPFDWWAPNGTKGLSFLNNRVLKPNAAANEGEYYYPTDQSARFVWYHDHTFGTTRLNAYAGVASAYLIRDSFEKSLQSLGLPPFIEESITHQPSPLPIQEIPLVIQDKIFVGSDIGNLDPTWGSKGLPTTTGSLWYPHIYERNRWQLLGAGRNLPNPSSIPEMFGDTMLANGTVFPYADVEPRRYRLRILNACSSRFLNLQLYVDDETTDGISLDGGFNPTNAKGPDFLVLGNEAGFLQNPVNVPSNIPFNPVTTDPLGYGGSLITGPAERWDVIVDFTGFAGKKIILYNDAPGPFPGGDPRNDYFPGAPGNPVITLPGFGPNTRQIMRFNVGNSVTAPADSPAVLGITPGTDLTPGIDPFLATPTSYSTPGDPTSNIIPYQANVTVARTRQLTLNETFDAYGRLTQMLGTNVPASPGKYGRPYISAPTEYGINSGDVEIWEIANLTADTHPMHFHLVNVQVLQRQGFTSYVPNGTPILTGNPRPPDPSELGWKETVKMNPGEVTWIIMKFDLPAVPFTVPFSPRFTGIQNANEYVWHCHILDHEEHDMMRPVIVSGVSPKFGVSPSFQTVIGSSVGQVTYFVFGGTDPYEYEITPDFTVDPATTPSAPSPTTIEDATGSFSVTIPQNVTPGDYFYTIKDVINNSTVKAKLTIV